MNEVFHIKVEMDHNSALKSDTNFVLETATHGLQQLSFTYI